MSPTDHVRASLDPQIAQILEQVRKAGRPHFWQLTPEQARASYRRAAPVLEIAPARMARVEDFSIRARDDYALPVRLYVPEGVAPLVPAPLLIYLHGGGFTVGDLETHDAVCRMFALRSACLVLAIDYRLGPEHRFPCAVDDAWDAFHWAFGNAAHLGADPQRIAIGGDSAGGTLATVTALRARDHGMRLVQQVLIYPGCALHLRDGSRRTNGSGYLLDTPTIDWFFSNYFADDAQRDDWRFAPLDGAGRPPLAGVAPACIVVAGYDPLYDEGVAYARALEQAQVAVSLLDYPGMIHGFFNFGGAVAVARTAHEEVAATLAAAFLTGDAAHGNR